jgi:hypothetical protein
MRSRILTSLLLGLIAAPLAPARAQQPAPAGSEADQAGEGSETEGTDVADEEPPATSPRQPPARAGQRDAAPGEVHTVVPGDTLWELSQRYLGTPWYWPKVWSYNPTIANPHWIYPGNQVRMSPEGAQAPEGGAAVTEVQGRDEGEGGDTLGLEPRSGEDLVEVSGRIGFEPRAAASRRVVHEGFVTRREVEESGVIDSSFSEALMLSYPDTVYVRFRNRDAARVGDRYVVFRTVTEVRHPVTGEPVGFLTRFLGTLQVVGLSRSVVTAQVAGTWDEMTRGDRVGAFGERMVESVQERPNETEVRAVVVTALVPYLTILGEHHEVVLDRGSADGVQLGNTFTVVRQQDLGGNFMNPARDQDPELPLEEVARCLVVDVKENTSNCLLTRSIREVVPGDRVEMRVGKAPRASR